MANTALHQRRRSPLAGLTDKLASAEVTGARSVAIREIPFTTQIGLRAEPGTAGHTALATQLPSGLPDAVGQVTGDYTSTAALWLGPTEYLLVAPEGTELLEPLTEGLANHPGQVVDLSSNRTIIEITGTATTQVLRKSCPLDLDESRWPAGQAYATTLAQVPVLIWRVEANTWWILPRSSFAEHVAEWILDAMKEFSSPEL